MPPRVIVDGDSCPVPIRDVLVRWHERGRIVLEILANRQLPVENPRPSIVSPPETVDDTLIYTLQATTPEERTRTIVMTRDIPLAERLLQLGVYVVNDRGDRFDTATIGERRSIRDRNAEIRELGLESMDRRRRFGKDEVKAFADTLDRIIAGINAL